MKEELVVAFNKVKATIDSCDTIPRLETARRMVENFRKLYGNSGGGVHYGYLTSRCNGLELDLANRKKVCFISGHRDITQEEFDTHYTPKIKEAIMDDCDFVVGDCNGVDDMAMRFLAEWEYVDLNVTVYHMFTDPRYFVEGLNKNGGWKSDVDRDFGMTLASDFDLCWIREGKERSGTAQNVERRKLKERGIVSIEEVMTLEASMFL